MRRLRETPSRRRWQAGLPILHHVRAATLSAAQKDAPMKTGQVIAQGDVLLIRTTKKAITPEHKEVPRDEHGRLVLAEGETSGHRHLFRDPNVCMLAREGVSDRVVTIGAELVQLLHDQGAGTFEPTGDHAPVDVPPGTYIVRTQREWSGEEAFDAFD